MYRFLRVVIFVVPVVNLATATFVETRLALIGETLKSDDDKFWPYQLQPLRYSLGSDHTSLVVTILYISFYVTTIHIVDYDIHVAILGNFDASNKPLIRLLNLTSLKVATIIMFDALSQNTYHMWWRTRKISLKILMGT